MFDFEIAPFDFFDLGMIRNRSSRGKEDPIILNIGRATPRGKILSVTSDPPSRSPGTLPLSRHRSSLVIAYRLLVANLRANGFDVESINGPVLLASSQGLKHSNNPHL
ncbi:uncharacterized protein ARMOST_09825 [Armillaria ostoyae]|uniref:Uncharacterized protein n=1 Tax=Armillaria ostoyae TaxID=47428 RepID=A0A284RCK5_ARMOS|nr:uncharacterized protein ARMOST_09825 [Armillaria ostoyae]